MMWDNRRWITVGDFIDVYMKWRQRGLPFLLSKLSPAGENRTRSAFDLSAMNASNWWMIPLVKERWNQMITGDPSRSWKDLLCQDILAPKCPLRVLSIGSGTCTHELELAKCNAISHIVCLDISEPLLAEATRKAKCKGIDNMSFICESIYRYTWDEEPIDLVLFHSSLHHLREVEHFLSHTIYPRLSENGYIVLNEYIGPNRLQLPQKQREAINDALQRIPAVWRTRYRSTLRKDYFYGSGWLRMRIADPSECVDSESILPALHTQFETIIERPYGGNLLMHLLKDISHHFVDPSKEQRELLEELFRLEDDYLRKNSSDFLFGVYQKVT